MSMVLSFIKKTLIAVGLTAITSTAALADSPGCSGKVWNPLLDLDFSLMGGIKVAGYRMMPDPKIGEPPGHKASPVCKCTDKGLDSGVGAGLTYWLPAYINDISKTAGCMQFLGGLNILPAFVPLSGADMYAHHVANKEYSTRRQVHWVYADLMSMAGKSLFEKCGATIGTMEISYLTEVDFMFQSDIYAAIMSPQSAIFAAVPLLSNAGCGLEQLNNSMGSWTDSKVCGWGGMRLPLSGNTISKNSPHTTNMDITIKYLARSAILGITLDTMSQDAICNPKRSLLYNPFQHRFQGTYPTKFNNRFNQHELLWGFSQQKTTNPTAIMSLITETSAISAGVALAKTGTNEPGAPTATQQNIAQEIMSKIPMPVYYPTKESGYMQVWEARQCCLVVVNVENMLKAAISGISSAEIQQMIELYNTASLVYKVVTNPIGAALDYVGGKIMDGISDAMSGVSAGLTESMKNLTKP